MFILHLALGGCLKSGPIRFGITADTGGHIAYVLGAAHHQIEVPGLSRISIVTRLFDDAALGPEHARTSESLRPGLTIDRVATACRSYLEKEALRQDVPAFAKAFCDYLARLQNLPDVIHAHFADAAAVAMRAKERFGIPVVYTPHALGIDKQRHLCGDAATDLRIMAERTAIALADAVIVSSRQEACEQVGAYGVEAGARIHCMPPGVPERHASPAKSALIEELGEWLDDPAKPILLAIARPVRKKNLVALVRTFAANAALAARANLVILAGQHGGLHGSVEERQVLGELKNLCSSATLRGRVALPPAHGEADVVALYRRASAGGVFVNPALHEPFGLTLIEAAASGVPVVATRHGGAAEIVRTLGHGLLIDPRDEATIGEACLSLVTDAAQHGRLAAAARRNLHHYSWPDYAKRSASLYRSLRRAPRLLACDIDGTLTGCKPGAGAFAAWQARRRLRFVVATGRSFDAARAILQAWRLPQPEAYIVDVGTRIMLPGPDGGWAECAAYAGQLARGWDRAAVAAVVACLGLEPQPPTNAGSYKLSYFGQPHEADAIRLALAAAALEARVIHSHGRLIDVLAPGGGKAAALAAYAARHGMTLADCIAAGDSGNDADMLAACGHAIVVGNADADLDHLPPRHGLHRVPGRHAAGVLEGLAAAGVDTAAA